MRIMWWASALALVSAFVVQTSSALSTDLNSPSFHEENGRLSTRAVPVCAPTGFYDEGISDCSPCRDNSISDTESGATSQDDCLCSPGYFLMDGFDDCMICEGHTFKPDIGNAEYLCSPCGDNLVLFGNEVAIWETSCYAPNGYEYDETTLDGVACELNYYRSGGESREGNCLICPNSRVTEFEATENVASCVCPAGQKLDFPDSPLTASCVDCGIGFYRSGLGITCDECPTGTTTSSTTATECVCAAGSILVAGTETCDPCGLNSWRTTRNPNSCTSCGSGLVTDTTGSTSIQSCKAPGGAYINVTGPTLEVAQTCGADEYREGVERAFSCDSCPGDSSTFGVLGSTSSDACICEAGLEVKDENCAPCPYGTYSDTRGGLCSVCSDSNATSDDSRTTCVCAAGHYSSTSCSGCPLNTYKTDDGDEISLCLDCGANLITEAVGGDRESLCLAPNGFEYNSVSGEGDRCLNGWYRSTGASRTEACEQCSGGRTTNGLTAAVSEDACGCANTQGWDSVSSSCVSCSGDTEYPDGDFGMAECTSCPSGATTGDSSTAAVVSDCKCPPGMEWAGGVTGSSCVACDEGFFSATWGDDLCLTCASGFTNTKDSTDCLEKESGVSESTSSTTVFSEAVDPTTAAGTTSYSTVAVVAIIMFGVLVCYRRKTTHAKKNTETPATEGPKKEKEEELQLETMASFPDESDGSNLPTISTGDDDDLEVCVAPTQNDLDTHCTSDADTLCSPGIETHCSADSVETIGGTGPNLTLTDDGSSCETMEGGDMCSTVGACFADEMTSF